MLTFVWESHESLDSRGMGVNLTINNVIEESRDAARIDGRASGSSRKHLVKIILLLTNTTQTLN